MLDPEMPVSRDDERPNEYARYQRWRDRATKSETRPPRWAVWLLRICLAVAIWAASRVLTSDEPLLWLALAALALSLPVLTKQFRG